MTQRAVIRDNAAAAAPPPGSLDASGGASFSPHLQARKHLLSIFRYGLLAGEWLELRCLDCSVSPARPGPRQYFRSVTALVSAAMTYAPQWDVFFGVATRRCPATSDIRRCPHREKGRDHVSRLSVCWADIDIAEEIKDSRHRDIDEALRLVDSCGPPPDIVVGSGVGLHAYWSLGMATHELDRVERLNRAIRERTFADNAVDAARILRVAGTKNYKRDSAADVALVRYPHG